MSSKRRQRSKPAPPQYTLQPSANRWVLPLVLLGIGAVAGAGIAVAAFGGWRGHATAGGAISQSPVSPTAASDAATPACCVNFPSRFGPTSQPTGGPPGMVWVPGGEFTMGSDDQQARADERPVHRVRVDGFWIESTPVTNAQFRKFVEATGYVTTAERKPDWEEIKKQVPPGTPRPPEEKLVPASLVFRQSDGPVDLHDFSQWWSWMPGADWRHPHGPGSGVDKLDDHPAVQVSWDDAVAYAKWAGRRLPTEAEFEYAGRGGLDGRKYPWGDDPISESHPQCNFWQGRFPSRNTKQDGYERTSPVKTFPANGYGLYDMAGNVWEWCGDWYRPDTYAVDRAKGVVANPTGPPDSLDPEERFTPKRVVRGGSFLCNDSYCASYRAAARMKTSPDSGSDHTGFRCVMTAELWEKLKPTTRPTP